VARDHVRGPVRTTPRQRSTGQGGRPLRGAAPSLGRRQLGRLRDHHPRRRTTRRDPAGPRGSGRQSRNRPRPRPGPVLGSHLRRQPGRQRLARPEPAQLRRDRLHRPGAAAHRPGGSGRAPAAPAAGRGHRRDRRDSRCRAGVPGHVPPRPRRPGPGELDPAAAPRPGPGRGRGGDLAPGAHRTMRRTRHWPSRRSSAGISRAARSSARPSTRRQRPCSARPPQQRPASRRRQLSSSGLRHT